MQSLTPHVRKADVKSKKHNRKLWRQHMPQHFSTTDTTASNSIKSRAPYLQEFQLASQFSSKIEDWTLPLELSRQWFCSAWFRPPDPHQHWFGMCVLNPSFQQTNLVLRPIARKEGTKQTDEIIGRVLRPWMTVVHFVGYMTTVLAMICHVLHPVEEQRVICLGFRCVLQ